MKEYEWGVLRHWLYVILGTGGAFLIGEHLYTWRRWDLEIWGHEWLGLASWIALVTIWYTNRRRSRRQPGPDVEHPDE